MPDISPLAPGSFPDLPPVAGVRLAAAACGVRYKGRLDVMLAELAPNTTVAGVFTQSSMPGAPVDWCRKALTGGVARALVVNSGNSNVFTGRAGAQAVERTVEAVADLLPCRPSQVFVASTGVIGEQLPVERILDGLPRLRDGLAEAGWEAATRAISTTDTFPKGAVRSAVIDGATVTLCGIAKGSGMIAPDMATMLSFVFTDAAIAAGPLQALLAAAADRSFNCTTVDSDTSTSDTLMLFATGQAAHELVEDADDPRLDGFRAQLLSLLVDLAQQMARDGEGAQKFVTITVGGAESDAAARRIAKAVANSPLVKTAIAGEDANWGRIVMAVGKSGERADRDRLAITIGGVPVAAEGVAVPGFDEAPVAAHMKGLEIDIAVDVGVGEGTATVWTCDLTHGYININADYRT